MAWAVCSPTKLADTLKTSIDGPGGVRVATTVNAATNGWPKPPQMFASATDGRHRAHWPCCNR